MADKRFLGLGFTFSAQDKGLETKLTNIRDLIGDISSLLSVVNQKFSQMQVPSSASTRTTAIVPRNTQSAPRSQITPTAVGSSCCDALVKIGKIQSVLLNEISQNVMAISKEVRMKVVGAPVMNQGFDFDPREFFEIKRELYGFYNDLGRFPDEMKPFLKQFKSFKVAMLAVAEYFSDVKDSANSLLSSVGIDFSKIIPEQVRAATKLVTTSLITGPFGLLKKMLERRDEKISEARSEARRQRALKEISDRIGGYGRRGKDLYSKVADIDENTKTKEKKGIFGSIKDFLLGGLGKLFSTLAAPLTFLFDGFTRLAGSMAPVIANFAQLATSALGLYTAFELGKDALSYFKDPAGFEKALGKELGDKSVVENLLSHPIHSLEESMIGISESISNFMTKSADAAREQQLQDAKQKLGALDLQVAQRKRELRMSGMIPAEEPKEVKKDLNVQQVVQPTQSNVVNMADYVKNLTDTLNKAFSDKSDELKDSLIKSDKNNNTNQKKSLENQDLTNDKLDRLIQLLDPSRTKAPQPVININADFDAKKYAMRLRQDEIDEAGSSGLLG